MPMLQLLLSPPVSAWIQTGLWGSLALLIIGSNLKVLFLNHQHQQSESYILVLGGIFGMVACLVAPYPALKMLLWLPLALDPGCWVVLLEIKNRLYKQ